MGVYGALGVAQVILLGFCSLGFPLTHFCQAFGMFMMGLSFTIINYYSAKNLHRVC